MLGNYRSPRHYCTHHVRILTRGDMDNAIVQYKIKSAFLFYILIILIQVLSSPLCFAWHWCDWEESLWFVGFSCHWAIYSSVVDGEFWISVLQLEWSCSRVLCWIRAGEGPTPLCIAPAFSCSPYTALSAQHLSHKEPWAPATQLMDKQGDRSLCAICFVVENLGIWPKTFLACVFALQSHWFPRVRVAPRSQTHPKVSFHLLLAFYQPGQNANSRAVASDLCKAALQQCLVLSTQWASGSSALGGWPPRDHANLRSRKHLEREEYWFPKGNLLDCFTSDLFKSVWNVPTTLFHLNATPGLL